MNIIYRFILFILTIFLLSGCIGYEYRDHYRREHTLIETSLSWGTLSGRLIILPDKWELDNLIDEIDRAERRIWIETYTWTEKATREAVLRAEKRWVDVRVILEGNVYGIPRINDDTVEMLSGAAVPIRFSSDRYTFTHMKMWIFDDTACISTGNWSYTTFTKNREFTYCSKDRLFLANLEEIFLSDFAHKRSLFTSGGLDHRIGLAPENLRRWLSSEIQNAKDRIIVFDQTISDPQILALLSERQKSGVKVELCQAKKSDSLSWETISVALSPLLPILESSGPYLHAKAILIDTDTVILWSANITTNAIDNNREIMIKIEKDPWLLERIKYIYKKDCKPQP
jgi:cardiolipin synthase A/B